MKGNSRMRRALAVATIVGALAAPAASAAPVEQFMPRTAEGEQSGQPAPAPVIQVSADKGFDWGDAGIGAMGALAFVVIATGAVVATRRRPDPGQIAA